jgi:excisionase family DNA binding protein
MAVTSRPPSNVLDVRAAAALLGVSLPTLRRWDKSGRLRARRHRTRGVRLYAREDVERFAAELTGGVAPAGPVLTKDTGGGTTAPFFGRERELARVLAARARFVEVLGPGGIGKTTLAKNALDALARRGVTGAFCDLAWAHDHEDVVRAIAGALAIDVPGALRGDALVAYLGHRIASRGFDLLVLDNVEQCASAASRALVRLARSAPRVRFIVTSRTRLALAPSYAIELGPLEVPRSADPARIAVAPSVRLLVHGAAQSGRIVDARANGRELLAIARRLDGIPLALELAAPHLAFLAPAELLTHLERQLDVLVRRRGKGPARHETMRAAVLGSFDLLGADERRTLAALSVFEGGFTTRAAEAVVQLDEGPARTLLAIERLCDHSLVHRDGRDGSGRLRLFDVVRDVAREQLPRSEREAALARHATTFVSLAARAVEPPPLPDAALVSELAVERENLAAAHRALIGRRAPDALVVALALEHAAGSNARVDVVRSRIEASLPFARRLPARIRALGHASVARLLVEHGRAKKAAPPLARALRAAKDSRDPTLSRYVIGLTMLRLIMIGDRAGALRELHGRAVRRDKAAPGVLFRLTEAQLGSTAHEVGELDAAERFFRRAEASADAAGDRAFAARMRGRRARVALDSGRHLEADELLEDVVPVLDASGDRFAAWAHAHRALCRRAQGRLAEARADYEQAAQIFEERAATSLATLHRAFFAAAAADLGREDEAARALAAAREAAAPLENRILDASIGVASGHLDALAARAAKLRGDTARAQLLVRAARAKIARARRYVDRDKDTRAAVGVLARVLDGSSELPAKAPLVVARDARWVLPPSAAMVAVPHAPARRLLRALVDAHRRAPDAFVSHADLVARGWPGERIVARAASQRLYAGISELRGLGLDAMLEASRDGYRIARGVLVREE